MRPYDVDSWKSCNVLTYFNKVLMQSIQREKKTIKTKLDVKLKKNLYLLNIWNFRLWAYFSTIQKQNRLFLSTYKILILQPSTLKLDEIYERSNFENQHFFGPILFHKS